MSYIITLSQSDTDLLTWLKDTPTSFIVDLLRSVHSVVRCNALDDSDVTKAATLLKRLVTDSGLSLSSDAVAVHVLRERERLMRDHSETLSHLQKVNVDLNQKLQSATGRFEELCRNMESEILSKSAQAVAGAEREVFELRSALETQHAHSRTEILTERIDMQKSHAAEIAEIHDRVQNNTKPLLEQLTSIIESHIQNLQGNFGEGLSNVQDILSVLGKSLTSPIAKIETYVDKFNVRDSTFKGRVMEDKLFVLLSSALPHYEVELCRDTAHTMDIRLIAETGQKILIDVKNYSHNVGSREIRKFHQDVITNACSGILLSVNTGVATKAHMQLDVIANQHPVIYLHCIGGDMTAVVAAVNVLNSVDRFIQHNRGEVSFDPEALHKMTETVKRLHHTAASLKENNDKQRRLICELETDSLMTALTGACTQKKNIKHASAGQEGQGVEDTSTCVNISLDDDTGTLQADCRGFCDLAVKIGVPDLDYFTLKDARSKWSELVDVGVLAGSPPSPADLKLTLQQLLQTECLKKKQLDGRSVYGVFNGFILAPQHKTNNVSLVSE